MAKIKKGMEVECLDVLYPLGRGLPLCAYNIRKEHRLAETKLQDFPMCDPKHCPKKREGEEQSLKIKS